jgi:S-DNA-T family DNA segregation ATPase FtsK/SpoIIIE
MSKRKVRRKENTQKASLFYEISGIFLIALAIFSLVSLYWTEVGAVGKLTEQALSLIAGDGKYLIPPVLAFIGINLMVKGRETSFLNLRTVGIIIILLTILSFLHLKVPLATCFEQALQGNGGGLLGAALSYLMKLSFGKIGGCIFLTAAMLIGFLLLTGKSFLTALTTIKDICINSYKTLAGLLFNFLFTEVENRSESKTEKSQEAPAPLIPVFDCDERIEPDLIDPNNKKEIIKLKKSETQAKTAAAEKQTEEAEAFSVNSAENHNFQLPPVSLLNKPLRAKNARSNQEIADNILILEETLESFGIKAKVVQVARGPAITRYELQPPPGIKVSRIVGLADDIALKMAAPDVRIEAPIPGKAAIGIEVPNKEITPVLLSDLIDTPEFEQAASKLTVVLGKDIAGTTIYTDLAKMPHLLIAGSTGSGKSVCLNSLILSTLFKASPDEVKLLMIDPKMVELNNYNGIPHLVSPVITDAKKSATSLRWAVKEMENRYKMFAEAGVRDIYRYNEHASKDEAENIKPLPLVVIIIDELADLMMVAPHDVEDAICRLAQMARAAGMHLVVATQRPSVDVITGLIKANIPSRISFAVSSQTDSRTILDMGGAEKLLGKGDMLFYPVGASKPKRVQGTFLSDIEVEKVVEFLKKQAQPVYNEKVVEELPAAEEATVQEDDELLAEAVKILIENGNASISMLQRRLHIGYARAARLIDIMEQRGIVGGYEGSKPRAILMTLDQYYRHFQAN